MNTEDGTITSLSSAGWMCNQNHTLESALELVSLEDIIIWVWQVQMSCPERNKRYYYKIGTKALDFEDAKHLWWDCVDKLGYMAVGRLTPQEVIDLLNL